MNLFQGKAVTKALHTPSNYHDQHYQRFIRIFSLQIKDQPIKITMKQMFTFNNALLKSVSSINNFMQLSSIQFQKVKNNHFIYPFQTIVLITTYVAIVIQFQIADENASRNSGANI